MSEVCCELGFVEAVLPQTYLMTSWESMTRCRHLADAGACHGVENHSRVAECTRLILSVGCAWGSQGMLYLEA